MCVSPFPTVPDPSSLWVWTRFYIYSNICVHLTFLQFDPHIPSRPRPLLSSTPPGLFNVRTLSYHTPPHAPTSTLDHRSCEVLHGPDRRTGVGSLRLPGRRRATDRITTLRVKHRTSVHLPVLAHIRRRGGIRVRRPLRRPDLVFRTFEPQTLASSPVRLHLPTGGTASDSTPDKGDLSLLVLRRHVLSTVLTHTLPTHPLCSRTSRKTDRRRVGT